MDQTRTKTIKTGITKGKERMGIKVLKQFKNT